jgi:hypothetical protein
MAHSRMSFTSTRRSRMRLPRHGERGGFQVWSTMTRSLSTLDEKGLINRKMIEGHCLWDTQYSAGSYTKYIELTSEGQKVAQTLTNENVKC